MLVFDRDDYTKFGGVVFSSSSDVFNKITDFQFVILFLGFHCFAFASKFNRWELYHVSSSATNLMRICQHECKPVRPPVSMTIPNRRHCSLVGVLYILDEFPATETRSPILNLFLIIYFSSCASAITSTWSRPIFS